MGTDEENGQSKGVFRAILPGDLALRTFRWQISKSRAGKVYISQNSDYWHWAYWKRHCPCIRRAGNGCHIAMYDIDQAVRQEAETLGIGDIVTEHIQDAVLDADLIILAVPVGAMSKVMEQISGQLKPGAVITDTGSTKRSVIQDISPLVPQACHFIPSHPLAGTEFSGPSAGFQVCLKTDIGLFYPKLCRKNMLSV